MPGVVGPSIFQRRFRVPSELSDWVRQLFRRIALNEDFWTMFHHTCEELEVGVVLVGRASLLWHGIAHAGKFGTYTMNAYVMRRRSLYVHRYIDYP